MNRKYDREFKLEAVRMAQEEGTTAVEVEGRLGIGKGMVSRWKRQLTRRPARSPVATVPWMEAAVRAASTGASSRRLPMGARHHPGSTDGPGSPIRPASVAPQSSDWP